MRLFLDRERRLRLAIRLPTYVILVLAAAGAVAFGISGTDAPLPFVLVATVAALVVVLLLTHLFRRYVDHRAWPGIGATRPDRTALRHLFTGFAVGLAAIVVWFACELTMGWVRITGWSVADRGGLDAAGTIAVGALLVLLRAAVEEVAFRGYVFANLAERMPTHAAALLGGFLFGLLHLFGGVTSPGYFLAGMAEFTLFAYLLTVSRLWTGTLWMAIGVHGGWNWAQDYLVGVGTATLPDYGDALVHLRLVGPGWAVGAAGNVDAGLVNFIALAVVATGIALLARTTVATQAATGPA